MKKYTIFSVVLILVFSMSFAQSKKTLHYKARKEFDKMRYAFAIPLYHNYLLKGGKDSTAYLYLAICYTKLNKYDSAMSYLIKAEEKGLKYQNYLPELYANNGDYENARKKYKKIKETNQTMLTDARLYGFDHLSDFLGDSLDYVLNGMSFNSEYNEFGAVPYKGGLVFESNRKSFTSSLTDKKKMAAWDGNGYTQLYFNNLVDSNVQLFSTSFKNKFNIGSISFTKDGYSAYYTKNASKKNKKGVFQLEIWESRLINGNWTKGNKLFFNNPNFSYFHPFITSDGRRLYYVSDDSTGLGGTDIYFIDKNEDGSWKNTQNAGSDVNTQGNELFPTYYDNTLYFSSNGHPGIGGLDIYKLIKSKSRTGDWEVQNLGYPINSAKDDFSYSIQDTVGYFSSNRKGQDDVFSFNYKKEFIDIQGSIITDTMIQHSGNLYYSYTTSTGEILKDSVQLDAQGHYSFKGRANKHYELYVVDNLGAKHSFEISTSKFIPTNEGFKQAIPVLQIKPSENQLAIIKAKKEATALADLSVMTRQFKRAIDSLGSITKEIVVLHHPFDQVYVLKEDLNEYYKLIERVKRMRGKKIVIVSASDCTGDEAYNQGLSKRRVSRVYNTLSNLSENEIITKSVGETELLNDCSEITNQKNNRYSYVFILNK